MLAQYAFQRSGATFNPATLSLSGWWRADYSGAPWAANASAGASLANGNLVTNLSDPATGTTQNGKTPADFNGTTNNLANSTDAATLFTTTAGTIVCLFYADTAAAPTGNVYDDACFYVDSNGDFGMSFSSSGVAGFAVQTAYKTVTRACSTGAYHLAMMRIDGVNIGITVDSLAEVTAACTTLTSLTGTATVGRGYGGSKFFDGRILELMLSATTISNTNYGNIKSYVNSRYALSL